MGFRMGRVSLRVKSFTVVVGRQRVRSYDSQQCRVVNGSRKLKQVERNDKNDIGSRFGDTRGRSVTVSEGRRPGRDEPPDGGCFTFKPEQREDDS